jgi:hypothetical protein
MLDTFQTANTKHYVRGPTEYGYAFCYVSMYLTDYAMETYEGVNV